MIENYGSIYYNKDKIEIHNPWELAQLQKEYPIFKDQEILNLIELINNPVVACKDLRENEYVDLSKEINKKYKSVFTNTFDFISAINWSAVPNEWAAKKIIILCDSLILKSVSVSPVFSRLPPFFSVTGEYI